MIRIDTFHAPVNAELMGIEIFLTGEDKRLPAAVVANYGGRLKKTHDGFPAVVTWAG
tara:strand:- start:22 stop:192 length:171 start_codon:yes stop_codon:yes gene_type:complete